MTNKYHDQLKNFIKGKARRIEKEIESRNIASKELFKKVNKPKKRFNKGGKV